MISYWSLGSSRILNRGVAAHLLRSKTLVRSTAVCLLSRSVMSNSLWPHGLQPSRLLCPWDSPGQNTGVGCHFLLQGNLHDPGVEPASLAFPALAGRFFTTSTTWEFPVPELLQKVLGKSTIGLAALRPSVEETLEFQWPWSDSSENLLQRLDQV